MTGTILTTFAYLLLLNILLFKVKVLQFKFFKPWVTLLLFNTKFAAGLGVWVIYTFYYGDLQNNDIHKFYTDALELNQLGREYPISYLKLFTGEADEHALQSIQQMKNWYRNFDSAPVNENQTIIRLLSAFMFFTGKVYFTHILLMCFISLMGFVLLTNAVFHQHPSLAVAALPVLFLPSVLFWMSGVLKEPLLIFGIGLFVHSVIYYRYTAWSLNKLVFACVLILYVKFYVLICLLPAAVAFIWAGKKGFSLLKYVGIYAGLAVVILSLAVVMPRFSPLPILAQKQKHAIREAEYFNAGSRIKIPEIHSWTDMVKAAPIGLMSVFFRPLPMDAKNPMMLMSTIENILIMAYIAGCVIYRERENQVAWNIITFLIAGSAVYFILIGISTPVIGNLVRYKAPVLPLILFALALLSRPPEKFLLKLSTLIQRH